MDDNDNDGASHDAKSVSSEMAVREPAAAAINESASNNKQQRPQRSSVVPSALASDPTIPMQDLSLNEPLDPGSQLSSISMRQGVTFGALRSEHGSPDYSNLTNASVGSAGGASSATPSHQLRSFSELPSGSRLTLSAYDATLPMAYDNERFFDPNEGYHGLLQQAYASMADLAASGTAWVEANSECGSFFGFLWRWILLRCVLRFTNDSVNRLLLTRGIQDYLAFTTAYESFVLGGVIRELDADSERGTSNDDAFFYLRLALWNRNTCRILVRIMRHNRWDWFFHLYTQVTWSNLFYTLSLIPGLSFMRFTATENYPAQKHYALYGLWHYIQDCFIWLLYRLSIRRRPPYGINPNTAAANLASDAHHRAQKNRNHYGTYFGRERTMNFRLEHRLTIDESIVRTFMTDPEATLIDNGVEHVLHCLANHWANMLYQENGNFAHQRMEQLNPFEILRFYLPIVLTVLANLRGRSVWDSKVLGPCIKKLQHVDPSRFRMKDTHDEQHDSEQGLARDADIYGPCQAGIALIQYLKTDIVRNVCAAIPTRVEPLDAWLTSISDSFLVLQDEAVALSDFISTVESGISLGSQLLKLVCWDVPSERQMKEAIVQHILNKASTYSDTVDRNAIVSALEKLSPKDERTLKELVINGMRRLPAAQLLTSRVATLLERELRRRALDERIRGLSKGQPVDPDSLERSKWYWVDLTQNTPVVAMMSKRTSDWEKLMFVEVETNYSSMRDAKGMTCFEYIPVAEAISRAQKAFMTTEIEHCKRFSYYCFMEFGSPSSSSSLRTRLRRLATLAQVQCSELDKARLNSLTEIRNSVNKSRKSKLAASRFGSQCPPQNVTVVGGYVPSFIRAAKLCK
jgi:hypothetical protein